MSFDARIHETVPWAWIRASNEARPNAPPGHSQPGQEEAEGGDCAMRPTRIFFLMLVLASTTLNGLALAALYGGEASPGLIVEAALFFNLVTLPVAVFAAYRMGGMAGEIYREQTAEAVARAGHTASRHSAARQEAATASFDTDAAGQPERLPGSDTN